MITQKHLKEVLNYDPATGVFRWKKTNKIAGGPSNGYVMISIENIRYYAHRLAWLYTYGYIPESQVDHEDQGKTNNRIDNLREVTQACNQRNTGNPKTNTSGVKGVYWNKKGRHWHVQVSIENRVRYIGISEDFAEAVCMRLATEQSLNWSGCNSSSPAYQYVKKMLGQ